jgi:hypothetical protein
MGMRTALSQARVVTIGVLAALLWTVVTVFRVFENMDLWGVANAGIVGDAIGTNAVGGILGLLVMTIAALAALHLLAELGDTEPAPDTWPPE